MGFGWQHQTNFHSKLTNVFILFKPFQNVCLSAAFRLSLYFSPFFSFSTFDDIIQEREREGENTKCIKTTAANAIFFSHRQTSNTWNVDERQAKNNQQTLYKHRRNLTKNVFELGFLLFRVDCVAMVVVVAFFYTFKSSSSLYCFFSFSFTILLRKHNNSTVPSNCSSVVLYHSHLVPIFFYFLVTPFWLLSFENR